MAPWKLGPHDMQGGESGKQWARSANIVKAVGNPAVLHEAPDHAKRLWRWVFNPAEQDRMLDQMAVVEFADRTLSPLNGYHHSNLWIEGPNEIARGRFNQLVSFLIALKDEMNRRGYQLTGPCSATGDYEAVDIVELRKAGLGLWTFHGYMTAKYGPTIWNAYRMRQFWLPGDPPVVYSECGYDRCRDAPNGAYEPPGDGPFGWEYQFALSPDPDADAANGCIRYAQGLTEEWEHGATLFTTSPNQEWDDKGFSCDPLVQYFVPLYEPWTPEEPGMIEWCPFAIKQPIDRNYNHGRSGHTVQLVVDHIADGLGNPWGWFNRVPTPPDEGSSAHFWVAQSGELRQYVSLADMAWANGPKCNSDMTVAIIADCVRNGTNPNDISISIEHEGYSGDPLTVSQVATSRKLHHWIRDNFGITMDRQHVVGHYQIDSCTRANCPGNAFPWGRILLEVPVPPGDTATSLRDEMYAQAGKFQELGKRWEAIGYPHMASYCGNQGEAIKDTVAISKGEK